MGLLNFGIGNTNIDRSLSLKENIQNTVLNSIMKTTNNYQVKTTTMQSIKVDCSNIFKSREETIQNYINANKGNVRADITALLTDTSIYDKMCIGTNLKQIGNIDLNSVNQHKDEIAAEIETNIKNDLTQAEETKKDKDWVNISYLGKNINESKNIQRIVENLEKSNITEIVKNSLQDTQIKQEIKIGLGKIDGAEQIATIQLMVKNITDTILEGVDKTFYEKKITQYEKTEEKDSIMNTIGEFFSNLFSTIETGIGTGGMIVLGMIVLVGFIAAVAPQVFCFIPGINMAMGSTCSKSDLSKTAYQDHINRPQQQQYYPQQQQYYPQPGYTYPGQPIYPQPGYPQYNNPQTWIVPHSNVPQQGFTNQYQEEKNNYTNL